MGHGSYSRRHIGQDIESDDTERSLKSFLEQFAQRTESLKGLANSSVNKEDANQIMLATAGTRWFTPEKWYTNHQSAWEFYSKVTNYLSLDFRGGQQPMEHRASQALGEIMQVMF
jgi:hypothetical protein